jgi:hypothetical protein
VWHAPGLHGHPEAELAAIVELDAAVRADNPYRS